MAPLWEIVAQNYWTGLIMWLLTWYGVGAIIGHIWGIISAVVRRRKFRKALLEWQANLEKWSNNDGTR